MSRRSYLLLMFICLLIIPLPAGAQDTPPATPANTSTEIQPTLDAILNQAQEASDDAEAAANRSEQAANNAEDRSQTTIDFGLNIIDLLGSLSGIISAIIAVIAGIGGVIITVAGGYYIRTIQRAIKELKETRASIQEQFEKTRERLDREIELKQAELNTLREDLRVHAQEQRLRTSKALRAQSLLSLGEQQYRAGNFGGALETYQKSHELDTENIFTLYRLGYVSVHAGFLDKAEEYLNQCLQIDPRFDQALATLGYTYRRIGEKLDSGQARSKYFNRSQAKLIEALEISHRLIDDDGESWWGSLGGLYRRMGLVDDAVMAYQNAAEVTPFSSYPFSNLALLQMTQNNIPAMLDAYKKVEELAFTEVRAQKNNYWAYNDLLTSRLAQGKMAEAEEALATLFYTVPTDFTYALEVLLDTLRELTQVLREKDYVPQFASFIDRIEKFVQEKQINEHVEK
jgi:tetratricopeptide (TPR) repeat protein